MRRDQVEISLLFLRLVSVGLLSTLGWVHLHLWQAGYRHIPTIGPLFLVAAVSTVTVAVSMLVWPSRLVGLLGFTTATGILASLIVSINVGVFGFTESLSAPFAVESIVLEMAAALTLSGWVAVDLMMESRQTERAVRAASQLSASTMAHPRLARSPVGIGGGRPQHEGDCGRWKIARDETTTPNDSAGS